MCDLLSIAKEIEQLYKKKVLSEREEKDFVQCRERTTTSIHDDIKYEIDISFKDRMDDLGYPGEASYIREWYFGLEKRINLLCSIIKIINKFDYDQQARKLHYSLEKFHDELPYSDFMRPIARIGSLIKTYSIFSLGLCFCQCNQVIEDDGSVSNPYPYPSGGYSTTHRVPDNYSYLPGHTTYTLANR